MARYCPAVHWKQRNQQRLRGRYETNYLLHKDADLFGQEYMRTQEICSQPIPAFT